MTCFVCRCNAMRRNGEKCGTWWTSSTATCASLFFPVCCLVSLVDVYHFQAAASLIKSVMCHTLICHGTGVRCVAGHADARTAGQGTQDGSFSDAAAGTPGCRMQCSPAQAVFSVILMLQMCLLRSRLMMSAIFRAAVRHPGNRTDWPHRAVPRFGHQHEAAELQENWVCVLSWGSLWALLL